MNPGQQGEFRAACGHLIPARADHAGQDVRCPHCAEPIGLTALYATALIGGLLGAGLIYLVMFDEFDESELVTITPLWFFPIVFGLYGFVSQRVLRRTAAGRTGTLSEATRISIRVAGPLAGLMFLPFLVLKWRSSLLVSLTAATFWAVLLWLFFAAVFPTL